MEKAHDDLVTCIINGCVGIRQRSGGHRAIFGTPGGPLKRLPMVSQFVLPMPLSVVNPHVFGGGGGGGVQHF